MADEPKAMREIHEIRERLSEEISHMAPGEYTVQVNRTAEEMAKKYGLKLIDSPKSLQHA